MKVVPFPCSDSTSIVPPISSIKFFAIDIPSSAISIKHAGEYLDIHCGGVDNAFPHHTNEIAQSEAYLGHKWCNYWFHVLHLLDKRGKMSKSKGGFLTVSLLEEKGYDPLAYRFFCLQSHYRKPLVFSFENLDNCVQAYNKLVARIAKLNRDGAPDLEAAKPYQAKFKEALDNDLNTSLAVTALYDVLKGELSDATKLYLIKDFDYVLSLGLIEAAEKKVEAPAEGDDVAKIEELIAQRAEAKAAKNWGEADRIRDALKEMGVVVKDTKDGPVWERI